MLDCAKHFFFSSFLAIRQFDGWQQTWTESKVVESSRSRTFLYIAWFWYFFLVFLMFSMLTTLFTHSPSLSLSVSTHIRHTMLFCIYMYIYKLCLDTHTRLCRCLFADRDTTEICRMNIRLSVSANTNNNSRETKKKIETKILWRERALWKMMTKKSNWNEMVSHKSAQSYPVGVTHVVRHCV